MKPRYNINEDFYTWFDSLESQEIKNSIKKINVGEDIDSVLEDFSHTINQALLHAVFINIKNAVKKPYDAEACRAQYLANTPKNYQAIADHIVE